MSIIPTGARQAQLCGPGYTYYATIDECVPTAIATTQTFINSLLVVNPCPGGVMRTQADLQSLRYCDAIMGELVIEVADPNADFTALYDIEQIYGLCHV